MKNLSILFFSCFFFFGFTQSQKEKRDFSAKKQYTPYFKFKPFTRDIEPSEVIDTKIRALEIKDASTWNGYDSVVYAYELILLGLDEKAYIYLVPNEYDTLTTIEDLHLIQEILYKNGDFIRLQNSLESELKNYPLTKEEVAFRLKIAKTLDLNKNDSWDKKTDTLFAFLYNPVYSDYKSSKVQRETILVPTAKQLDDALRHYVRYSQSKSNPVLSKAYEEFGDFLHKNLYESNAYIAFSVSRYYDKRNNSVSKKLKVVKEELESKNYIVPSFRKVFKKIQPGRFDYTVLKERRSEEVTKTKIRKTAPKRIEKDYIPSMNSSLLIMIGIFSVLLLALIFLRTKPKKIEKPKKKKIIYRNSSF